MYNVHNTSLILEIDGTKIADIFNALVLKLRRRGPGNRTNVFNRGIIVAWKLSSNNREINQATLATLHRNTLLTKSLLFFQHGCTRCIIFQKYKERKSV